ncbi:MULTISPECIES: FAD:protein FMN transferase [Rhizobium]|uniref:FAD:protein FMN transferase n=1 Tax=Rhizobium TaxID=379 RepID=UPI001B3241B0|nr:MULTISPECIES: FAD:protein FMN transferase [Rhizobium]MBX4908837.1 FAD:protein FMN transferase [Rhizobium bangladeshense]MBX5215972.1 FAD:protein FMN transferase [Rhizobium sp. NLR9a]MBX5234349.1 FAD:protein FMN transferase [Rhizobium sp. NLR4a]MBX5246670.1 FAD:protein FMN transferase [Rhizobium sp. NLR3b]MBX5251351.1 FAD:protein FMN transferase [Rhizobium sp. NLR4b]
MPKTFTDLARHALNGPTMGTRWSALFHMPDGFETAGVYAAMAGAVAEVDRQMSTWKPESDLNRLNAARPGEWVALPEQLVKVLQAGLAVGVASGGAFDIGIGDAVAAWGFGVGEADAQAIKAARRLRRNPAHDILELDAANGRVRKHADMRFDLNGIAKGYGVDRLAEAAALHGIEAGLFAIDGELRARGAQPDGTGWAVAVEKPHRHQRAPHSIIELEDAAVATSGDYRHWVDVGGHRLSHTIDPCRGMPLEDSPASATVIAHDCMSADAWATAMMVLGEHRGLKLAKRLGLSVVFLFHGREGGAGGGVFASC